MNEFDIHIKYSGVVDFSSSADLCGNSYNEPCSCSAENNCANYAEDGLHHKNLYNMWDQLESIDKTQKYLLLFLGHEMCEVRNGKCEKVSLLGQADDELGIMWVGDFRGSSFETGTIIHELGHMYGTLDHYDIFPVPSTEELNEISVGAPYNRSCLYGEDKDDLKEVRNYLLCEGCSSFIERNKDRCSHG